MKKLALVLGTLLIAATASAKEVVAAPVVVAEPVVVEEVVAPVEVPKFKPSGFVAFEEKYYGAGEHDDVTQNYLRSEFSGSVTMTEADTLQFRVRSYDDLNGSNSDVANAGGSKSENTETRYRWLHKFGNIGDSKIGFATRVELLQRDDYDKVELQTRFNFTQYVPQFDGFETTDLTLAPKVRYVSYGETDDSATGVGMDLSHYAILPWGFEWDLTVYYLYNDNSADGYYNSSQYPNGNKWGHESMTDLKDGNYTKSGNNIDVEAYLYNTQKLWASEDNFYNVNFYAEGGLDALTYRDGSGDTNNNSMYVMPELQLVMNINAATAITVAGGAEYRNWNDDEMSSIKDFTWQPYGRVKIKTTF
ncbi:MAG: FomA family porin-like outer membrane protein [Fusobacteriaceae bacterium]